ncbi:MAG: histidine kinase [Saprospiraceae bacterium]
MTLQAVALPKLELALDPQSQWVTMGRDAQGRFWLGNNQEGLLVWDTARKTCWQPLEKDGFMAKAVSQVFCDNTRQIVWISTHDHGLFRYDLNKGQFTLFRHDESQPETSLGAYITHAICQDGSGNIWVATEPGGVSRYDHDPSKNNAFITLNTDDGLPSNQVYTLCTDKRGHVWAGTAKGLVWINHQTLQIHCFGEEDGLLNTFFDLPLSLGQDGSIMSGMKQGFQHFHPDNMLTNLPASRVLVTDFKVFDQPHPSYTNLNEQQAITLDWTQNFFTIDFVATDFFQSTKNTFAYRLKGFDKDWVYTHRKGRASYTNVPPGDYILEIKTGREREWQPVSYALAIRIMPPWWLRGWFKWLVALTGLALVWSAYRWRIARVRREEALKNAFNQKLAQTEMAALRAQMNPHFVFNCLSAINRFILVNQPEEASAYLTKFSRLIRLILDNSRTDTVPLDKELDALKLYIEMEQMRFSDRFEYTLYVAPEVQPALLEIPPLLIQPFVENAIWHGLMHRATPGLLSIKVELAAQNKLTITIEDNGVGRTKAVELKSKSATPNKSLGMTVTTERIAAINQLYGTDATVAIIDLTGELGQAIGTKVVLQI